MLIGDDGVVTEATHSSIVGVRGDRIEGTPEGPGIMPGTNLPLIRSRAQEMGAPLPDYELPA